jgi:hypothetical protein
MKSTDKRIPACAWRQAHAISKYALSSIVGEFSPTRMDKVSALPLVEGERKKQNKTKRHAGN